MKMKMKQNLSEDHPKHQEEEEEEASDSDNDSDGDSYSGGDSPSIPHEDYTSSDNDPVVSSEYEEEDNDPVVSSEYEEEDKDEEEEVIADQQTHEIDEAVLDYMQSLNTHSYHQNLPEDDRPDPVEESDSSEDEVPSRNTVGDVPLEWYKDEQHIGYDIGGKKIKKKPIKDQLDSFLAQEDDSKDWRKIYDEYNDEEIELSKEEIKFINRLRKGKMPHAEVNPYEPYVDWFDWEDKGHPLSNAPEPKRRFIPSKWEAKKNRYSSEDRSSITIVLLASSPPSTIPGHSPRHAGMFDKGGMQMQE